MSDIKIDINESPIPKSPVVPEVFDGDHVIHFRCYKGISCFNACCKNIDISLTPYDIIRLRKRLNISSSDFLKQYTFPYEMEKDGMAGVKLNPVEEGTACRFMTEEGCSVYEDRPTSCRYYPAGLLSLRKQDEYTDRNAYALVKEEHCLGHNETREISIDEYRREQGVEEYDELVRGWRQLVLKKKSSGPYIGQVSKRSRQLFFMVCYDIDTFRMFVGTEDFLNSFNISEEEAQVFMNDDVQLMQFGFRLLRQVLFGEKSLDLKDGALESRIEKKKQRQTEAPRETEINESNIDELEDPYKDCSV